MCAPYRESPYIVAGAPLRSPLKGGRENGERKTPLEIVFLTKPEGWVAQTGEGLLLE